MSDLYLIAHKVRNEPAFDVAHQIPCPECDNDPGCPECDGLGYWWIIPTSGHRAYPCWELSFKVINMAVGSERAPKIEDFAALPDHYPSRSAPTISLAEALGLNKPKAQPPIIRRL